jgi:hypothetical protein
MLETIAQIATDIRNLQKSLTLLLRHIEIDDTMLTIKIGASRITMHERGIMSITVFSQQENRLYQVTGDDLIKAAQRAQDP